MFIELRSRKGDWCMRRKIAGDKAPEVVLVGKKVYIRDDLNYHGQPRFVEATVTELDEYAPNEEV